MIVKIERRVYEELDGKITTVFWVVTDKGGFRLTTEEAEDFVSYMQNPETWKPAQSAE